MTPWLLSIVSITSYSLGMALLQTLWQGAILYILLRVGLIILKNASASVRYALSYTALGGICIWFICDWISQAQAYNAASYMIQASGNTGATYTSSTFYSDSQPGLVKLLYAIEHSLPYFWYLYIPGLMLMMARLILNMLSIHTYRTKGIVYHKESQANLEQLMQQMNIVRKIKVYLSDRVKVPAMMGTLRPYILLPVTILTQLDEAQLHTILMHELAHIKRHDYILNLLQVFVETVLFFNPFVWLVNGIIRREREHCCDDMVIKYTQQPYHYATALAQLEQCRTAPTTALAATGNKYHLFTRIKRIIEMKKNPVTQHYIPGIVLVCIALLIPMFWFTPGFAQKVKENNTKNVKKVTIVTDSSNTAKEYITTDEEHIKDDNNDAIPGKHKVIIIKSDEDADYADSIIESVSVAVKEFANSETLAQIKQSLMDGRQEMERARENAIKDRQEIEKVRESAMDSREEMEKARQKLMGVKIYLDKDKNKNIKEIQNQVDKIDWDAIGEDITGAMKDIEIQLSDTFLPNVIKTVQKELKENRDVYTKPAKDPYQRMLDKMQHDGLINKSEGFEIEKEGNHLYINGDKQPKSVYDKYSYFLSANQVTIKGKKNRMNINVRD
ncbi:MAG: M56 family metallopeptidase [Flavipsychrobacter sp.]|nr:M56 family metallopeptidase [Flavipsychrobacter sp.]